MSNINITQEQKPVILVDSVSVQYRVPHEQLSGIKEYVIRWLQNRLQYKKFWALKDVFLDIQRGEFFGIVGRNGAGKSTLLKTMARVIKPTLGRVVILGRTAPLLDLGAGFHPELSGRENIFLNGALLGLTQKTVGHRFDEIVAFSEIGEFINAPLRTYSTGMVARLGFAVATSVRPDIMLVDEVLSVGDTQFQEKCLARMNAFREQGTTIVLVSHSMERVKALCERAIWLEDGKVAAQGKVSAVVGQYLQAL
ncbi:MAG: ABC transporter ATP-binding protein [Anaerolineales bacterium]|nr:ABC transporter ATP-binding protein [Chloroflexota bacterium]MBL6979837.1 ABC transporter ATP-binding protein [Anaerolineales bacterium]